MKTKERLVEAAAALLDEGGEPAVTLRAVGKAAGVSQNAPYRHFEDRSALLAAVAVRDFQELAGAMNGLRAGEEPPLVRLRSALARFVDYGQTHPARYRLFFSDLRLSPTTGELEEAALGGFRAFAALVEECQRAGDLPSQPTDELAGLISATAHGLLDMRAGGRMRREKGVTSVMATLDLLLGTLSGGKSKEAES